VSLAAALFREDDLPQVKAVAVILSGGNLDPAVEERLLG
jgi:threonine dehydratase